MRRYDLLFAAVLLFALAAAVPADGQAVTTGGPGWATPENISNMPTDSAYPKVVAGADGAVHVFWAENLPEYGAQNNIIYYARRDANGWSQPVDILISPQGLEAKADQPDALMGQDGRLHVVFVGGWNGEIYYASADAASALDSRAWSGPTLLSGAMNDAGAPNILEEAQGGLRVIFQCQQGKDQGVYQTTSADDGASWSQPALIPGTSLGGDTALDDLRAALSPQGVIHVTWMWSSLDRFPPKGIFYARSGDLGVTWSQVETVIDGPYRYPDVAVSGDKGVLMVWSGTSEDRFKYYRGSPDGGLTWSERVKMTTLGGLQGYTGLAADSAGKLHLGMVASCFNLPHNGETFSGDALIHSVWNGVALSAPEPLLANTIQENNLQYADIAISEGNIAHMVLMYPVHVTTGSADSSQAYQFEVFYVRGVLDAPHVQPQPVVPKTSTPAKTPASTAQARATTSALTPPTPGHLDAQTQARAPGPEMTPANAVLIGALPVLILMACLFILRAVKLQR